MPSMVVYSKGGYNTPSPYAGATTFTNRKGNKEQLNARTFIDADTGMVFVYGNSSQSGQGGGAADTTNARKIYLGFADKPAPKPAAKPAAKPNTAVAKPGVKPTNNPNKGRSNTTPTRVFPDRGSELPNTPGGPATFGERYYRRKRNKGLYGDSVDVIARFGLTPFNGEQPDDLLGSA